MDETVTYYFPHPMPDIWRIKRIKGKRSFLNWFPKDEYEIYTDCITMRGGEELIDAAVLSGATVQWVTDADIVKDT